MASNNIVMNIIRALSRARLAILSVALTYLVSLIAGTVMVHTGNTFALSSRDNLVGRAKASDPSLIALDQGKRFEAALWDAGRNLLAGFVDTLAGLGIIFPFPWIAYRGWVGGIVSVDDNHVSRLANPSEAGYYLLTLLLQLVPYTLAGGMGVNIGIANFRPRPFYQGEKWLTLPKEAIRDALRAYLLIAPLFLIASLWEFLAR